ncbi:MAG: Cof-type HAD-IIB family hydrolase [Clostridiales bacterium]|nr:Cof-type HAD-IIB family hydrolase [Clostridiales bacterium]
MSVKIIASDLDGTLMAPDHESITERTLNALVKAHEMGVKLAISTGRTLSHIKSVSDKLPFIDYIIYSNGAAAYDCKAEKTVFSRPIDRAKAAVLMELISPMDLFMNVYAEGKIYAPGQAADYSDIAGLPKDFLEHFMQLVNFCGDLKGELSGRDAEIITAYYMSDGDRRKILDKIRELGGLTYVSSIMDNIEIMSDKAGKGAALSALCSIEGCTRENAMAFGDASNDCSMLEFAKYSFAMANGDEACKRSAAFVTASNGEDGVAQAVERLVLNL